MKILHISDLHIGNAISPPREGKRADELAEAVIERWGHMDDSQKPIVVITGDIVDSGLKWQYRKAEKILKKLKRENFSIVPVPGNHDYGPKGLFATEGCYNSYCRYINNVSYPWLAVEEEKFTIIGLNSMEKEMGKGKYWADGKLGGDQIRALEEKLSAIRSKKGNDHVIVAALHHHPFDVDGCDSTHNWWHRLKDGDQFMAAVSGKIDLLLFGHEHQQDEWRNECAIPLINMCDKSTRRRKLKSCMITLRGDRICLNKNPLK